MYMSEYIYPENLKPFQIPESFLQKLYELTGDSAENSKGFLLAFPDSTGAPMIYCTAGSQIVEMGIRKALEKYLIEIEEVDSPFNLDDDNKN